MKSSQVIPEHKGGIQTNTESSVEVSGESEAKSVFEKVKKRLMQVNHWHEYAGSATADFQLTDAEGKEISRTVKKGDHFKIRIPAPALQTGEGSDWVRVEAIDETEEEEKQFFSIRVRPASNPCNNRNDIAHFFSDEATSSFVVRREKNKITAGVYGRNEKPNTDTESLTDTIRNAAVATGAISGFSKLQWKSLVNGLIKTDA